MGELTDDGSWVCVKGGMGSVSNYLGDLCMKNVGFSFLNLQKFLFL